VSDFICAVSILGLSYSESGILAGLDIGSRKKSEVQNMIRKKWPRQKGSGRPTKYDPRTHPEIAEQACRMYGSTNYELADLFGLSERGFLKWQEKYPEFKAAIRRGKDEFDTERVEAALLLKALGTKEDGSDVDVAACKYWLRNRAPNRWPDKRKVEVDGEQKIKHAHDHTHTLNEEQLRSLTVDQLRVLRGLASSLDSSGGESTIREDANKLH
jgi:hypothetical protein